jgi:hypothetical protein
MKTKLVYLILLCFSYTFLYAQDSVATRMPKKYKNQIGVDMTALLQQFFNLNGNQLQSSYIPYYFATYRRHFKNGNIRFAFSTRLYGKDDQQNDSLTYKPRVQNFNYRVGYEWFSNIDERWQVFYGIDFKNNIINDENELDYQGGGWGVGHKNSTMIYAISPMLGFRFKFTKRVSILTETSLDFLYSYVKYKPIITQITDNPINTKPSDFERHIKTSTTAINYPLFIEICFDL